MPSIVDGQFPLVFQLSASHLNDLNGYLDPTPKSDRPPILEELYQSRFFIKKKHGISIRR